MSDIKPPKITHVAIRFKGEIYSLPAPNRHHNVIRYIVDNTEFKYVDSRNEDEGFLDEAGRYLNRKEALLVALANDQIKDKSKLLSQLYSEDVW